MSGFVGSALESTLAVTVISGIGFETTFNSCLGGGGTVVTAVVCAKSLLEQAHDTTALRVTTESKICLTIKDSPEYSLMISDLKLEIPERSNNTTREF